MSSRGSFLVCCPEIECTSEADLTPLCLGPRLDSTRVHHVLLDLDFSTTLQGRPILSVIPAHPPFPYILLSS